MTSEWSGRRSDIVVFDLGGVLVDWNPRYLYRQLLPSDAEVERFLAEVTTSAWNLEQDRGRPWSEAVEKLTAQYPEHAELIAAYDARWEEMIGGAIEGTVDILRELRDRGSRLYALTNWSAEKFDLTYPRFEWMSWFEGIVVSGRERLVKPDTRIFQVLFERYGIEPSSAVYIDDNPPNVDAARGLGMTALRFTDPDALRAELSMIDEAEHEGRY
ncbi:HAD family hydrolase [Phytoactinopolyspora halotolerans]|uniref:HAD family phosphatase n=1 Tax=Phytoactinopolyspora halotolerans TaxID=1981512 RepID=A0A6L9SA65_9ACTN|nr:HAD family phosphatase [Phytoactinopolyspora halotolerans]NEE02146.1 HAD family phosphatase [Phytoactinopolyspora halotolerans]